MSKVNGWRMRFATRRLRRRELGWMTGGQRLLLGCHLPMQGWSRGFGRGPWAACVVNHDVYFDKPDQEGAMGVIGPAPWPCDEVARRFALIERP